MQTLNLDAVEMSRKFNINIKITRGREAQMRFWIATQLCRLAVWIMPASGSVEANGQ